MVNYNIVIIGGGPGGYVAALEAAKHGFTVALFEKKKIGGTCLNWGCIPTKALISSARNYQKLKKSEEWGLICNNISFDMEKIQNRKELIVNKLRSGVQNLLKSYKIEVFSAEAEINDKHKIIYYDNGEQKSITGDKIIIATGSLQKNIPFLMPDGDKIITSDHALNIKKLPKNIAIVGGGVIGLEFAHFFASFGVEVIVIEALKGILPGFDIQLAKRLGVLLKKQGVKILTNTMIKDADILKDGVKLILGEDRSLEFEKVLVAVGRKPNISGIKDNKIKIENGFISTDNNFMTSVKNVYAIGDVTNRLMLAHFASAQAEHLIKTINGNNMGDFYKKPVPACVFSSRDLATVGKTEDELKSSGIEYNVGNFNYQACSMAVALGETDGIIKILSDKDGNILGAHILGEGASELIHEISLGIETNLKVQEISEMIHAHPTLSELVKEASGDVFKNAVHKYYRP